ncbi:hypothetical protein ACGFYV_17410 [Streptomyces sp. NPDC048297]|uniref:hypothetical protein n=1 Tax=Streptomyces sp. NPDC048297 TaxID=3365531 RepID=UPI003711E78A
MNVSQVPQPGDSAPRPGTGDGPNDPKGPKAHARADGDSVLWGEELPWVDDVSGSVGASSTAPHAPLDRPAADPGTSARQQHPATAAEGGDQPSANVSAAAESRRRGLRRPAAIAATVTGIGAIAVAVALATQHGAGNRADATPAGRAEVHANATGAAPGALGAAAPDTSPSPHHGASSASAGPAPDGSESALSASPSPGTTSAPAATGHDARSTAPHTPRPTHPMPQKPSATATTAESPYVIQATAVLTPGQSVTWGKARLAMTSDGNLVVTDERGVTRWASHTSGSGLQTVFQDDGCMAIYDAQGTVQWSSYTNGHPGAVLEIMPDGNVRIRLGDTVLWQTGTGH